MTQQDIVSLQQMLSQLGYHVPVSGRYDNFTRGAVTDIQYKLRITPDGEPNPNTIQAILESLRPVSMAKPQVVAGSYRDGSAPSFALPKPKGV